MALFSGKIETAYYINPEMTDVEIIYTQGDQHIAYAIQVDFEHPDFKDLLEEVSLDQLDKNTNQRLKQQSETFGNAVNHAVSVYMETEFKERKEQIEKDLDNFRGEWLANRDKEYEKKYGSSLEEQHIRLEEEYKRIEEERKNLGGEWNKLKDVWNNTDSSWKEVEKTRKDLQIRHEEDERQGGIRSGEEELQDDYHDIQRPGSSA